MHTQCSRVERLYASGILRFWYVDLYVSGYAFMLSVYVVNHFIFMTLRVTHHWAGPCTN
jgi:hypothetical protein